ncbi:hypothetical protein J5226_03220 [Lysobacter sp. K5869]|uniref:hypothetical protein n=1 Tax=Lysobacter sp. K5869 TaxID=2820808 RepID=UPI001C06143E|nr:hypothetical protein [Lysobacter sp. K5869]QWP77432.1 hypothetical protein J5226_03220 [Lysobacter sp. K5869]
MSIAPELQAKIDALEDEDLKVRIIRVITNPGKKLATNEEIFESMTSSYQMAKAQQARLRKWRDDEAVAFAKYFQEERRDDYAEFMRQEHKFNQIEPGLACGVRQLISKWIPNLDSSDRRGLFRKFRRYARSQLAAPREIE